MIRTKLRNSAEELKTKQMIFAVMRSMNIGRMPSRTEMDLFSGNSSLTNRVMRSGGFYYWADKLNLKMKNSETENGREYESKCKDYLLSRDLFAELTPVKFPYDILVEKLIKIDVKISNGYTNKRGFFFTFNLENPLPRCDFYVFYCANVRKEKVLVVPATKLYGIKQMSIGISSKYDIYIDRWDLIFKQIELLKTLEDPEQYKDVE